MTKVQDFFFIFVFFTLKLGVIGASRPVLKKLRLEDLPSDTILHVILPFTDYDDAVSLAQTCKYFRTLTTEFLIDHLVYFYPQLLSLNLGQDGLGELVHCLWRPLRYAVNDFKRQGRIHPNLWNRPELFLLGSINRTSSILSNPKLAQFLVYFYLNIDNTDRTCINDWYLQKKLVQVILCLHYTNQSVIKGLCRIFRSSRSELIYLLYYQYQIQEDHRNYLNPAILHYKLTKALLTVLISVAIYRILPQIFFWMALPMAYFISGYFYNNFIPF